MFRRRLLVFILLIAVAFMGLLLFVNVRPSSLFRITPPAKAVVLTPAPGSREDLARLKTTVSNTAMNTISTTTLLEKPRYTGQDSLGRNWLLTADSAGQEGTSTSGTYVLQQVNAVWEDPSQTTPFVIAANQGRYTQVSSSLLLSGGVSATGIGFNLIAPSVQASLVSRTLVATGGSTVVGSIPGSGGKGGWDVNITAPTLNADQNSSRLLLTGGVHAILTPRKN